jgi:hypothetical protein
MAYVTMEKVSDTLVTMKAIALQQLREEVEHYSTASRTRLML